MPMLSNPTRLAARLRPFGPHALRLELEPSSDDDLEERCRLDAALRTIEALEDALVTERAALLVLAPSVEPLGDAALARAIARAFERTPARPASELPTREILAVYDGADLDEVASALGSAVPDVVARHVERELRASFLGFAPGFAYLRGLDPALGSLPRRASPRARIPPFSVAVAAGMSAVYPASSPGGWNLLGRAIAFDPLSRPLQLGERVRFRVASREELAAARAATPLDAPTEAPNGELLLTRVVGPALVVDGRGRRRLRDGAPSGGPLVPALARRALCASSCAEDDALIERHGELTLALAEGPARRVADERGEVHLLARGEELTLPPPTTWRVGYAAIEGGIDAPLVLGGRGVLLSAARGGVVGRALRRGDRLPLGPPTERSDAPRGAIALATRALVAAPGPDLLDAPTSPIRARIARSSDRVGIRLVGADPSTLRARATDTAPMRRGAVQWTPRGQLIVLGPDHPVTGGYPVVAVLDEPSLEALAATQVDHEVSLRIG